ncbi:MAG: NAD-dependent epimerase/dehydratase family protein [Flavobacteriales bacterium]|jgi:UDP-glucose 4-epimerase|nr:NAD-dependent epimerase/dehydratase family protein [Flavobacteriales bacterium]
MRTLVLGGAGFIGSHLVDALAKERNNTVIVFDNFHRGNKDNIKVHLENKKIKVISGDIRDYNSLKKIGKVDVVYHLAAQSNIIGSFLNPNYAFSTNVDGIYNVLKYSVKNKVKRFIFSSSREVYGNPRYVPVDEEHPIDPINMYGATKVAGETLCRIFQKTQNLKLTILRIANVYGPRDKDRVIPIFLENAKKNVNLELYGGKQVLDFIWVGDVIAAILDISGKDFYEGKTINIGTGKGTSIENLAKMVIKLFNSRSKIRKKKSRSMDVKKFITKSNIYKMRAVPLYKGLKRVV